MNKPLPHDTPASTEDALTRWRAEYDAQIGTERETRNRSGIAIRPLYSPLDVDPARYEDHRLEGSVAASLFPASRRIRAASTRRCIADGRGPSGN